MTVLDILKEYAENFECDFTITTDGIFIHRNTYSIPVNLVNIKSAYSAINAVAEILTHDEWVCVSRYGCVDCICLNTETPFPFSKQVSIRRILGSDI